MKRSIVVSFLVILALLQSAAHADVIYDLPNLEEGESLPPTPSGPPREEPRAPAPVERPREGHVGKEVIKNIPVKKSGTLYRFDLSTPLPLTNISIRILKGNLKIREGILITVSGERMAIREFKDVQVLPAGSKLFSEVLNLSTPIKGIEIRAESFLEPVDLEVEATSDVQVPVLRLRLLASSSIHVGDDALFSVSNEIIDVVGNVRVLEMLESGSVRVQFEKRKTPEIVKFSSLRKTVNCVETAELTVCKGDQVTYRNNFKTSATVYAILSRDEIMITLDDKYKNKITVSIYSLSK